MIQLHYVQSNCCKLLVRITVVQYMLISVHIISQASTYNYTHSFCLNILKVRG